MNGLHFLSLRFKKPNGNDLSDHNPFSVSINVWGSRVKETVGSCKGWTNKQTKLFRSKLRTLHQCDPSEPGYGTSETFLMLCKHMLQSMKSVNKNK